MLPESDPEVSEAVDFCEFYARSAESSSRRCPGSTPRGRGVVAVIPPWNFPIAIPCGGVAAALAAGNTVILKPAPETVATAWRLCRLLLGGGRAAKALQFVFGENDEAGARGSPPTRTWTRWSSPAARRRRFHLLGLRAREMRLLAETGGKNATIVTAMADRDLAIKHVVQSAFGHAGRSARPPPC